MGSTPYDINTNLIRSPEGYGFGVVRQIVDFGELVDGGGAAATLTLGLNIPAGSIALGTYVKVKNAFLGDTSAVLKLGKSAGEDEYTYGTTINVFTTGVKMQSIEANKNIHASDTDLYLTITSGSDWGDVTAGRLLIEVPYVTLDEFFGRGYDLRDNL